MERFYYYLKMDRNQELRQHFFEVQQRTILEGKLRGRGLAYFKHDEWTPMKSSEVDDKIRQLRYFAFTCHFKVVSIAEGVLDVHSEIKNGNFRRIRDSIIYEQEEISLLSFDEPSKYEQKMLLNEEIKKYSDEVLDLQKKSDSLKQSEKDAYQRVLGMRKKLKDLG